MKVMRWILGHKEVAEFTGYTLGTIRQFAHLGYLPPPRKRIGSCLFFAREDIRQFMRDRAPKRRRNK
jgi:predicted DNA-binding transcriptional regulator AlpA